MGSFAPLIVSPFWYFIGLRRDFTSRPFKGLKMKIEPAVLVKDKEVYLIIHIPNNEVKNAYIIQEPTVQMNKVFTSTEDAIVYIHEYNRAERDALGNYHIIAIKE